MIYKFSVVERLLLASDVIAHPFVDAASSVGLAFALGSAVKLKIADALSMKLEDVGRIAAAAQVSEVGAARVLDCLDALGYVHRSGRRYAFTRRGYKNLSQESPDNFRHFILFCDFLYKGYLRLDETIRSGARSGAGLLEDMTEREWELYARAMMDVSRTNLREVAGKVPVPARAARLLDLGGSHGQYSIELCRRHQGLKATVFDLEPVRRYAQECITRCGAEGQVSFTPGDFLSGPLPEANDVVLAFNVIHGLDAKQNAQLAEKVFHALQPGGIYVVLDQIQGVGGRSQLAKATTSYMALNLLHQMGGRTYSHDEVDGFARGAGFSRTRLTRLHAPGFAIVTCEKA